MWQWLKANPSFLIIIALFIASVGGSVWWFFFARRKVKKLPPPTGSKAVEKLDEAIKAGVDKDQAIKELEAEYKERLDKMSSDQTAQYLQLRRGPPEEVAKWIDGL